MTTATEVGSKLSTHEAVCAERYASINVRLRRLESILLARAGGGYKMSLAITTI
jgi:hypothetical protein